MSLKQKYQAEKEKLLSWADEIESATSYQRNNCLYHGSAGDSSSDSQKRMEWVRAAEREFLAKHERDILKLAAKKIRIYAE